MSVVIGTGMPGVLLLGLLEFRHLDRLDPYIRSD
jgi:hypothetical protein